ncbi:hypothetical protein AAC387_Pa04g2511 [Persea americana]
MSLNLSSNNFVTTEPEVLLGPIDYAFISLKLVVVLAQVEWPALHVIHHTNKSLHRYVVIFPWQSFGFHECQLQWPVEIQDGVNAMSATVKIQRNWKELSIFELNSERLKVNYFEHIKINYFRFVGEVPDVDCGRPYVKDSKHAVATAKHYVGIFGLYLEEL